ncbi:uncharacterized protein B0T15DRAFT_1682 [Chaetomium strumarium]|uniref:Uncharacterized protein n=1 Tax=Chaetomium strumarium TaxID=1170767 RepID=A0AAJ0H0N7_9PEZI|nr:hypothetical protein B0T15DRAFT_1682 [Chaetomium strumarium]
MDRGRNISRGRGAKKRGTLPSYSHHTFQQPLSDSPTSPTTPEPSGVHNLPPQRMVHTAPQRGGKSRQASSGITPHRASSPAADQALRVTARTDRPARGKTFHFSSFNSEPPSEMGGSIMAAAGSSRKRSRTFETQYDGAAVDDEAHSKGGHSLRKRARIDYTQEMIDDDIGLPAARSELVVKSASTPSARGRKKRGGHDGSDGESEDFISNPNKRHRTDKSPALAAAPARATSSRRRNQSKKSAADSTSSFVEQPPSDNEVQDTILVSLPNVSSDQPASEDESDRSSVNEPESPAASSSTESEESEDGTAQTQAQPPTPLVQSTEVVKDSVSVAAESEAIGDALIVTEPSEEKAHITPSHLSLTTGREIEQPGPSEAITTAPESASLQPAEPAAESQVRVSPPLAARLRGLRRLRQLGPIYDQDTPFASKLKLTPYLDEEVALPGPYTEWVYPAEPVNERSASISTPPPAPPLGAIKEPKAEWDGRRPLKFGEVFTLWRNEKRRRQEMGEPEIDILDFYNQCVRRYKLVHAQDGDGASATQPRLCYYSTTVATRSNPNQTLAATPVEANLETGTTPDSTIELGSMVVAQGPIPPAATVPEETGHNLQLPESRPPTAAPSPAPVENAMDQEDAADEEQDAEDNLDGQIKPTITSTNEPIEPVEVTRNPPKQYLFPKIRDPDEFVDAFEGWQDFSTSRLYETVAAAVETMHAYQQEYNELKKYLDDEENAKRRQANDKTIVNWENRQKADEPLHWRRHFDDAIKGPPAFEVRGARAPKPYIDDPVLEHQKEEDRIMAQAYGFKLNTHPTQVGRQNPEEQRWEMPENRLRKRTEKAELAEDNVVEGKRVRKPRYVSDQSKDVSRSGTPTSFPTFGPGRRPRRKAATSAANGDDPEAQEQVQATESFSETPRKGRAARSRGTMLPDEQDQMAAVEEAEDINAEDDEADVNGKFQASRKRDRRIIPLSEHPALVAPEAGIEVRSAKRGRGGKGEIASSSFYSNVSTAASQPDSRPSTAASDGTARTVDTTESSYSFRERRQRNYALENDPELEPRPARRRVPAPKQQESAEPKKRGPRKKQGEAGESSASAAPEQFSEPSSQQPAPGTTKFHNISVRTPATHGTNSSSSSQHIPTTQAAAGPYVHTFNAAPAFPPGAPPPPPAPPAVKKPITKIRFTNKADSAQAQQSRPPTPANSTSSSSASTTTKSGKARANKSSEAKSAAVASANADLDNKPYAEMTKSEKMSWSMRRRWASGEMQGAVEKRRSTLAKKKSESADAKTDKMTASTGRATGTGTGTTTASTSSSSRTTGAAATVTTSAAAAASRRAEHTSVPAGFRY